MRPNYLPDAGVLAPEVASPSLVTFLPLLIVPTLISVICIGVSYVHYLLFHTLAEVFSIIIAMTAMVVASTSRHFTRNHFTVYVAVVIGWCAALDLVHTVAYKGMNLLVSQDVGLATKFWLAARFLQALALLFAPIFLRRHVHLGLLHTSFALLAAAVSLWIFSGTFPAVFIEGQGLTVFKIYTEYVIILMLAASAFLIWRYRRLMSSSLLLNMLAALVLMILSEFSFTLYADLYGLANTVGHVFKIFSYWFVYLALVQSTLNEPFSMLSRTASTYDAVPDPAFVVGVDGRIQQANQAAARYAGMPTQALIGRSLHTLFHAADVHPENCPVCARISGGDFLFSVEIDRGGDAGVVECTVAPFFIEGRNRSCVQVVRDITERKQLASERELLVQNLGERIKEQRCLYAISSLIERRDLDVAGLLSGVVLLLPSAFLYPKQAHAVITSDWGAFESFNHSCGARCLERNVFVNGQHVAALRVCYPDDVQPGGDLFLPQEHELLDSVVQQLSKGIERFQAEVQIRRLTYLYQMLSATNRAIVHCRSNDELLAATFDALVQYGAITKLFIACTETNEQPWRIVHSHGIDVEHVPLLLADLSSPEGPLGQSLETLFQGKVICMAISKVKPESWSGYLTAQGLHEQAIVPLISEDRLLGLVCLYATGTGTFDAAQQNLLNEMTADLAFALNAMATTRRREVAELRASLSDLRFREVFDASPTPMQIHSLSTGVMRTINRAHRQWLGYALEDIATAQAWFDQAYPDPAMRRQLEEAWIQSVEEAKTKGVAHSPELSLHCKDGSERRAYGTMTVVGDDAIVAWVDLTEIRRSEQALRASDQHFRAMVEQMVAGIYVQRAGKFIYVNPRYCEMIGYTSDELSSQNVMAFTEQDSDNNQRIQAAWARLDAGEPSVSYSVTMRCKNAEIIELGLHATPIRWDGEPATIVMAADITAKKRAEAQIASYVKQLEVSMRGTLQAVSNMIDLRDPYTAGHERRVGLIAWAIARELGWPQQRCESLEMIGLVHDIGKIAVPAEILAKPGRLSSIEMELVKGHAQAGYDILKNVSFPFPVAEVIRQHHERLDGSGYPRGLTGDAILPEARVLAVADVLESMAAHRPYRPALGVDAALAELERGRGSAYDEGVLDAVFRLIRDKGYSLPQ